MNSDRHIKGSRRKWCRRVDNLKAEWNHQSQHKRRDLLLSILSLSSRCSRCILNSLFFILLTWWERHQSFVRWQRVDDTWKKSIHPFSSSWMCCSCRCRFFSCFTVDFFMFDEMRFSAIKSVCYNDRELSIVNIGRNQLPFSFWTSLWFISTLRMMKKQSIDLFRRSSIC